MSRLVQGEINYCIEKTQGVFKLEFEAPALAKEAQPGQFLHIRCGEGNDPLLRRPISIHAVDRSSGRVSILFQVVGRGTELLSRKKTGFIDVIGPLGRGFSPQYYLQRSNRKLLVIGGGIGAAPLFFLLQEIARCANPSLVKVLLGARSVGQLLVNEELKRLGFEVYCATDDGSAGHQGVVTDLLKRYLAGDIGYFYACGPAPMLKAVCRLTGRAGLDGEVSLEERMACGVGACLSCACRIKDAAGEPVYRRACVDGPVFPAGEVIW